MTPLPKLVSKEINLFLFWLVVSWTIAISSSLIWNIAANRYSAVDIALIHSKKSFEEDLLVRRWNASHGGVYVPITEKTPPNRCLSSISERDITTPSDRKLTMINPGTGLGLSIVHAIIKELNTATVEMESNEGQGSLFRIIMQSE
jgi:signal transduction histidine kinase